MLKPVKDGPSLVVCSTCCASRDARTDDTGQRGGALLLETLRQELAGHPCSGQLDLQAMPCLFACQRFCTVHLRSPGKIGYVLGDFTAASRDARALLDYAAHYIASVDGVVPWANWPQGVKGHFIVRTPPEGFIVE